MKKVIESKNAPSPLGPYSQAIKVDDMLFISGCLGINLETGSLAESIEEQAKLSLNHIKEILKAADMELKDVIKTTIFLADINDFAKVNQIYGEYFVGDCPARSCIEVSKLPKGGLIEIEAIAKKS